MSRDLDLFIVDAFAEPTPSEVNSEIIKLWTDIRDMNIELQEVREELKNLKEVLLLQ